MMRKPLDDQDTKPIPFVPFAPFNRRRFAAIKAAETRRAWKAVNRALANDESQIQPAIEAILKRAWLQGSHERIGVVLPLLWDLPPKMFWPVFLETWNVCDCTWPWLQCLIPLLRRAHSQSSAREFMEPEDGEFFDALPNFVQVYRGCARYRSSGISWTTDRAIGMKFARGMRFDNGPNRVLVEASVPKQAIFAALANRKESEIVLDPGHLDQLRYEPVALDWNCPANSTT
jgi:hypothetical protein